MLSATRALDASRFFKRGSSLLNAVVLLRMVLDEKEVYQSGLRLTSGLVISVRPNLDLTDAIVIIDSQCVPMVWSGNQAIVVQSPLYDQALPDLCLDPYSGMVTLLYASQDYDLQIRIGRTLSATSHDSYFDNQAIGAPLFDEFWRVIGLSNGTKNDVAIFIPISTLISELEAAVCWDEIAKVHRLMRRVNPESVVATKPDRALLRQAVLWDPDDAKSLTHSERKNRIAGFSLAELRAARGESEARKPEQKAIDLILAGAPYKLDAIGDEVLLPFATAARWFQDVVAVPSEDELSQEILRRRLVNSLIAIVGSNFASRDLELLHLKAWLANDARRPLVVRGPGGIGKSALLAKFILEVRSEARFAWIDFDRPDASVAEAAIKRIVDEQLSWQRAHGPVIIVLDSFESAVQTYNYSFLNTALDSLASALGDIAVVVGSRSSAPMLRLEGNQAEEWELVGLSSDVATSWLIEEGIPAELATSVAEKTKGVPLNLKLARELLKGKSFEEMSAIVADLPKELLSGYLYRRILRRLNDPKLKDEAQWAMVPRCLVPELLARILHVDDDKALTLFNALRSEVTLMEQGDSALFIRPDLRNTLLPLLDTESRQRVIEIDNIAARFWSEKAVTDAQKAQAVYHWLRLNNLTEAERHWNSSLGKHLRGYTSEEIPPEARTWLEHRTSSLSLEQHVQDLILRGDLAGANSVLHNEPRIATALSTKTRRRRLLGLAAQADLETTESGNVTASTSDPSQFEADTDALESIVIPSARPALRVRGTKVVDPWPPKWSHFESLMDGSLFPRAVGRVQLKDGTVTGTATLVGKDLFLTTRNVVQAFTVGLGHDVRIIADREATINMQADGTPSLSEDVKAIDRIVLVHPIWDVALFRAVGFENITPLKLATRAPADRSEVLVIGHPTDSGNVEQTNILIRVFENRLDVKRLMPGEFTGVNLEVNNGLTTEVGRDDSSTLGRDLGAAVIDPRSGELLGIRLSSLYLSHNFFVPSWKLVQDSSILSTGIETSGPVEANQSKLASQLSLSIGQAMLDCYIARNSGDMARALALLDLLAGKQLTQAEQINGELLKAACYVESDPIQAGEILEALIDRTPVEAWDGFDLEAAIATMLRLAVDADAELELVKLFQRHPNTYREWQSQRFRVIIPIRGAATAATFAFDRSFQFDAKPVTFQASTGQSPTQPRRSRETALRDCLNQTIEQIGLSQPTIDALRTLQITNVFDLQNTALTSFNELDQHEMVIRDVVEALEHIGFRRRDPKIEIIAETLWDRVLAAHERCFRLEPWTRRLGPNFGRYEYWGQTSTSDYLEIVAAYVAFPQGLINPVDSMLEKLGLSPHPILGWYPVLVPLRNMLAQTRSGLPDEVSDLRDLAVWLEKNFKSSRLGSYLNDELNFPSIIYWQAGLWHLTTALPLEKLLERRLTSERRS